MPYLVGFMTNHMIFGCVGNGILYIYIYVFTASFRVKVTESPAELGVGFDDFGCVGSDFAFVF